jgi:Porin subfamily
MEVEMKMVKSLLLGSAAGIVAVAGAQAADYPVKAAAVQYVKICNLYGDGFYYLPGTNICVKIGGYARAETTYSKDGLAGITNGPFAAATTNAGAGGTSAPGQFLSPLSDRADGHDWTYRSRAYISMDTREQTEWGTLRTYVNIGLNYDSPTSAVTSGFSGNRAFIQFAGFTFGLAQSFFDFYSVPLSSYWGFWPSSDTGDSGWKVLAYTATFGGGISSTISVEEPRRNNIISTNMAVDPLLLGQAPTPTDYIKMRFPDFVWNGRIDQSWGSVQIMGALHDASAAYYTPFTNLSAAQTGLAAGTLPAGAGLCAGTFNPTAIPTLAVANTAGTLTGSEACGHPADKLGWAFGAGFKYNIIPGKDYVQMQYTYTKGAVRYAAFFPGGGNYAKVKGATMGYGFYTDGIVSTQLGTVHLTEVWNIVAAYEHFWTPALRTSVYGVYERVDYDNEANLAICNMQNNTFGANINTAPPLTTTHVGALTNVTACNNDWGTWNVGSRTQYNFTPAMYIGIDVIYSKLQTASAGSTAFYTATANTAKPSATYQITNQDNWAFRARFHRDILP